MVRARRMVRWPRRQTKVGLNLAAAARAVAPARRHDHARLCDFVGDQTDPWPQPADACHVDDGTPVRLHRGFMNQLCEQEDAPQVDLECLVPYTKLSAQQRTKVGI